MTGTKHEAAGAERDALAGGLLRSPRALSPSRANDFKLCPLKYRLRAIDRTPEPPTSAAARGTVVHAVPERMFGMPPRPGMDRPLGE